MRLLASSGRAGRAGWKPGQRVVIAGGRPCRRCRNCIGGRPSKCLQLEDVARGVRQLATNEGNPIRLILTP
jgi:threonine dehydrogenase-like Zn-dependent dehydrogenase